MQVEIRQLSYSANTKMLVGIREKVFVEEQGVPRAIEMDGQELVATHFLAFVDATYNKPETVLGSARLLHTGQIGRMAVLKEFRGLGVGRKLLQYATEYGFSNGLNKTYLHAQKHAQDFYEKAGYTVSGDVFLEAGIEHIEMFKKHSPEN